MGNKDGGGEGLKRQSTTYPPVESFFLFLNKEREASRFDSLLYFSLRRRE